MKRQVQERAVKHICRYLSGHLKQAAFDLLYSTYRDEGSMADDIGCSRDLICGRRRRGSQAFDERYMPAVLSLALDRCPEAAKLLEEGLLKRVQELCSVLGIGCHDSEQKELFENDVKIFLHELDEKSRKIFWHLRLHRHAKLSQLAWLIGAPAEMDVLYRINEIINPAAVRILGAPALNFEECRFDAASGENILFNWWLSRDIENSSGDGEGKPILDFLEEGDHVAVILEYPKPAALAASASVEQRHGIICIRMDKLMQ
ncbi:hypothetical protein DFR58_12113 [Anaerobacterium chartisolvens]|uniref:Uncharacterized protein n=1 Tax=Anaerobacterium chartisolvens TaxID=1297424 RepID=A0A369AT37_9FIRM|nr:hypothetical protein [Anaerobacterium chartisolvens]RCX12509.1 hypothetical protein DFR58_12113 [Anaerobacterium chartisolvens]